MGTLIENILSRKRRGPVRSGDEVVIELDTIMSHDTTTKWAIDAFEKYDCPQVKYPERVVIPFDHTFPAPNETAQEYHDIIANFAEKHGIKNIFNKDPVGISHQILPEKGFVWPGAVIVGGDSHSCTYGAFGAFGFGVGSTEIAVAWATGQILIDEVPETVLVELNGEFPKGVYSKDLFLEIGRKLGLGGANNMVLEFQGSAVRSMSIDERMTLSNMAVEVGATSGLFEADSVTLEWLKSRTNRTLETMCSGPDAAYAKRIKININELEPLVACPPTPDQVRAVSELDGMKVDKIFIGTCTNSRISDWEIVHRILKDKEVKVPTLMAPASKEVADEATKRGYYDDLKAAGVVIDETGCSACLGRTGVFPEDNDVVVTTMNRNFPGRMGNPSAKIYLVSPATAAMTALNGKLTSEVE